MEETTMNVTQSHYKRHHSMIMAAMHSRCGQYIFAIDHNACFMLLPTGVA